MAKKSSADSANKNKNDSICLSPSPRLPLLICVLGLALLPLPLHPWPSLVVSSFGGFLLLQAYTLRIEFTKEALVVSQLGRELRRFPFENWLAWRILFPALPGILYFREKASPHLLPILFDPVNLENQLRLRVGTLERPKETTKTST